MPVDESIPRQWHPPKLIIWRFLKDNSVVTLHQPFCRINALGPMVCENERCTGFHEKTPFQLARSLKDNIIIELVNKIAPCRNLYCRRPFGIRMGLFPSVPAGTDVLYYIPSNGMNMYSS
jgi:hypothetical protein